VGTRGGSQEHAVLTMMAVLVCLLLASGMAVTSARGDESSERASGGDRPLVVFGGDQDFYPYEFLDIAGRPHGFNIDLMREIGARNGWEIRFQMGPWRQIRKGIEEYRTIDVSDMYWSETRARVVDFCDPFTVVWDEPWVRKGGPPIQGLEDLVGRRVLVNEGGYIHELLSQTHPEIALIPVPSEAACLRQLAEGIGDVALVTQVVGRAGVRESSVLESLERAGPPMLPRAYSLVVAKGRDDLRQAINQTLARMRTDGTLERLEAQWMTDVAPPGALVNWFLRNGLWALSLLVGLLVLAVVWLAMLRRKFRHRSWQLQQELAERIRVENALRESQEEFRLAFHLSPVVLGISTLDEGRYLDVNEAFEAMTGWSRAEAIGKTAMELGLWADPEERRRAVEALQRDGRTSADIHLRNRSGEVMDVLFRADIIPFRGTTCILTSATDISERKAWERSLQDAEERWKFALEGAGEGVWDLDVETGYFWSSRRFQDILGYREAAAIQDFPSFLQKVHPEERGPFEATWKDFVEGRLGLLQAEVRIQARDGSYRWVHLRGMVLRAGPERDKARAIGTIQDITERKAQEEERKVLEERLRRSQRLELVGQLAGGIAHDFNNHLMVIRGYCDLLAEEGLEGRAQGLLAEIIQSTERAAALTKRLLAFGRKQVSRPQVLQPNQVLREMEGALRIMTGEGISIEWDLAGNLGHIRMDREQLEQVIVNLVVNARDAMPGGGRLMLRTRNIALDREYVRMHPDGAEGPHVMLVVQDTGIGMNDHVMSHIFEPFFTTKPEGKGTGQGLSIVYGAVRQAGGHITVDSTPGRGTTFRILLPRCEGVPAADHSPETRALVEESRATILFVEDDPHLFELLRGVLEQAGYEVLASPVPEEAVEMAENREGPIHLLVSDVMMPGLKGPDVLELVRRKRPGIPVLFISGYPKEMLERSTTLPPDLRLLGKPFSSRHFLSLIREILAETAGRSGADASS